MTSPLRSYERRQLIEDGIYDEDELNELEEAYWEDEFERRRVSIEE